jgi:DNA-binding NtrC family response regulator
LVSQTVLVVDQQRNAQALKAMLDASRYAVRTADRIEQAFKILQAEAHIGLVLAELSLPQGGCGQTFIGKVRLCYPSTAVLLMTGLPDPPIDPGIPVLVKPFSASTLIERVDRLLVESRRTAESLRSNCEWSCAVREELRNSRDSLHDNIRRSRQQRADRFRRRLRTPGVVPPTVLVVEDDFVLRYAVCRYLTQCGFRVLAAANGWEALEISRQHSGRIALLLTDLRMPGLDGLELIGALSSEHPETASLVMTGEDVELPRRTVRKPFELDDLLIDIATVLTGWVD